MTKPEVTGDDLVCLFFPETDTGRAAGYAHLARVATRLATVLPEVSEAAAKGQISAIAKDAAIPFEQVRADLAINRAASWSPCAPTPAGRGASKPSQRTDGLDSRRAFPASRPRPGGA